MLSDARFHRDLRADRSSGPRQHQQVAGGIARVGKTLCERLGILALAGLFHRSELEVFGSLDTDVLAIAQMDQRRCNVRGGGSAARFSRFSTRARIRHVRRSNRAGERIAAGRKKTEGLSEGAHRSGVSRAMDHARGAEKTFGGFVARGGNSLSAQSLAANDGGGTAARRSAGGDPI